MSTMYEGQQTGPYTGAAPPGQGYGPGYAGGYGIRPGNYNAELLQLCKCVRSEIVQRDAKPEKEGT